MTEEKASIIDVSIEQLEEEAEEKSLEIKNFRYLKKLVEADEISMDQAKKAMEMTCYGHLAGCCGPEKGCPIQFSVCKVLGVDPVELFQVKKDAVDAWLTEKLRMHKGGKVNG